MFFERLVRRIGDHEIDGGGGQCSQPRDGVIARELEDRKSTRLNSSHSQISYAVFCLKKKKRRSYKNNRSLLQRIRFTTPSNRRVAQNTCHHRRTSGLMNQMSGLLKVLGSYPFSGVPD